METEKLKQPRKALSRPKAGNGEGTRVREVWRSGQKYFTASFTESYDPLTKKQVQRSVTRKTKAEVLREITILRGKNASGDLAPSGTGTVGELLDSWLAHIKAEGRRPRTIAAAERLADTYVKRNLGTIQLKRLTPKIVQSWVSARRPTPRRKEKGQGSKGRRAEKLSPVTMRNALGVLKAALNWAIAMEMITKSPAAKISPPRKEWQIQGRQKPHPKYLDPEEVQTLLAEAKGTPLEAYFAVTFLFGLRPSECLGLVWFDPDDEERGGVELVEKSGKVVECKLHVYNSLLLHPETQVWELEGVKTEESHREITTTSPRVIDAFRRRRAQQKEERLKAGDLWKKIIPGLIFADGLGRPIGLGGVRRSLKRIVKKAKLPQWATPYHGRHSAATNSLAAGVPLEDVSRMLGHADIQMTANVYGHAVPARMNATADAMASVGEPRR